MKKLLLFAMITLLTAPNLLLSQQVCGCQYCVTFDTLGVGVTYGTPGQVPGDLIFIECDIPVTVETFEWTTGGTTFNWCETMDAMGDVGPKPTMWTNNINLKFDFTSLGFTVNYVTFEFADFGGNENISVNGEPIFAGELTAAPVNIAPGVTLSITTWTTISGTYGIAVLHGEVESLLIGGQEFLIDNICASPMPPFCVGWDFLAVGKQFGNPTELAGDWIYAQNNINVYVEYFEWTGGGGTFNICRVEAPLLGFGITPIMNCNNINLVFDFTELDDSVDCVEFQFLDMGGNENISVNGGWIFAGELTAAPVNIVPGVTLTVYTWSVDGGIEGRAILMGPIQTLLVGGQEFWIDNICAYHLGTTDVDLNEKETALNPNGYWLGQNVPNPFNATTRIQFYLPNGGEVSLNIFSVLGKEIRSLTDCYYTHGYHSVNWDGKNANGNEVASGIYLYKLEAEDFTVTKRLNYIR